MHFFLFTFLLPHNGSHFLRKAPSLHCWPFTAWVGHPLLQVHSSTDPRFRKSTYHVDAAEGVLRKLLTSSNLASRRILIPCEQACMLGCRVCSACSD